MVSPLGAGEAEGGLAGLRSHAACACVLGIQPGLLPPASAQQQQGKRDGGWGRLCKPCLYRPLHLRLSQPRKATRSKGQGDEEEHYGVRYKVGGVVGRQEPIFWWKRFVSCLPDLQKVWVVFTGNRFCFGNYGEVSGIWFAPDFASCFCIVWICATDLGFPDQFVGARATQFGHSSCYLVSVFCSDSEVRIILLSIKETWVRSLIFWQSVGSPAPRR